IPMLTCSFALHHVPCTVAQRSTAPNIIAILHGVGGGWWAVARPRLDPDTPILKSTLGLSPLSSDGPSKPIRGIVRMAVGVEPLTVLSSRPPHQGDKSRPACLRPPPTSSP